MAVDVGMAAIIRDSGASWASTYIECDNPANADGTITQVEVRVQNAFVDLAIGIFVNEGGTTFSTRSFGTYGVYAAGYHAIVTNLAILTGDYIGFCENNPGAGQMYRSTGAGVGYWYKAGIHVPAVSQVFTLQATRILSIYGTGPEGGGVGAEGMTAAMGAKMIGHKMI